MIARVCHKQAAIRGDCDIARGIEGGTARIVDHAQRLKADGVTGVGVHARRFRLRADAKFPDHRRDIFLDVHTRGVTGRPRGEGQRGVVESDSVL